ncbi:hypothetical protein [Haloferula rosea]|uniref:HEAT repeat domain-containing protein n=1 Tax=Haloferula rosea TaxID=490093 RepID=A0A934VEZ7_9BACT|nr:hypothetical protein [Haloferula rosea]MBK1826546.1 hypothetical protein [Haloferula rosea]
MSLKDFLHCLRPSARLLRIPLASLVWLSSHAAVAQEPLPEKAYQECRDWYQSADFPSMADRPWVRVATGNWFSSGGKKQNTYLLGFLTPSDETAPDAPFEVTTIDRQVLTFTPTPADTDETERVGFEKLDFEKWLGEHLGNDDEGDHDRELVQGSPFGGSPSTPALTLLHLAMECDQRGLNTEARKLMARLPQLLGPAGDEEIDLTLADRMEEQFAHVMMWRAVVACDYPTNSRPQLLDLFTQIVRLCPKSKYADQAAQMAERLDTMILEDKAHAKAREEKPFEALSREEQIKDLVFQLRDQDGAQWSQPGSCSIFSFGEEKDSPADKLVEIGFDAVPFLIDALVDRSLTYSVGYHRNFYFSHRVLTVGDAATQVIERITGTPLPEPRNIRVFGDDPKQDREARVMAAKQEAALKWWLDFESKGEQAFLIEEVSKGGQAGSNLASRLIERYREEALKPCLDGLDKSSESWAYSRYVRAIAQAEFAESEETIRRVIEENRFSDGTMTALHWLVDKDADDAMNLAAELLTEDESWRRTGDFNECLADELIEFLIEQDSASALQAIVKESGRLNVSQRVDVATGLYGADITEVTSPLAQELLVLLLEDQRRRTGMSGNVGDLSFSDPRVCDLAGAALHKHWPTKYEFDYQEITKRRNQQRIACANIWRSEHGKELLECHEREVTAMTPQDFTRMIEACGDLTQQENLAKLCQTLEDSGVSALPPLLAFLETTEAPVRDVLAKTAGTLGNRIERITLLPAGASYPPVTNWIQQAKGQALDGARVVSLLSDFFRQADQLGEPYRGLEFEALRHGDHSGIDVTIRLIERERRKQEIDQWSGTEHVSSGEETTHTSSYGGGLSKDDPKESEDLREGVDKALANPPGTPCEVRWELIGWWHDD